MKIMFKRGFYLYLIDLEKYIVHNILPQESFFVGAPYNYEPNIQVGHVRVSQLTTSEYKNVK
jgi:hypothetical protein